MKSQFLCRSIALALSISSVTAFADNASRTSPSSLSARLALVREQRESIENLQAKIEATKSDRDDAQFRFETSSTIAVLSAVLAAYAFVQHSSNIPGLQGKTGKNLEMIAIASLSSSAVVAGFSYVDVKLTQEQIRDLQGELHTARLELIANESMLTELNARRNSDEP